MFEIEVKSTYRSEMIDITHAVEARIDAGFNGVCHLFSMHTTAALTVNENADPDVKHDMLEALERIVPYNHPSYRHCEGNSDSHVKASLMGFDLTVPVRNGKLLLGVWQSIYFCEFDGPRRRKVTVTLVRSA